LVGHSKTHIQHLGITILFLVSLHNYEK